MNLFVLFFKLQKIKAKFENLISIFPSEKSGKGRYKKVVNVECGWVSVEDGMLRRDGEMERVKRDGKRERVRKAEDKGFRS